MNTKTKLLLMICLPLIGILAGYALMTRTITVTVDGETSEITTHALTVKGALRSAGIPLDSNDSITPAAKSWLTENTEIVVQRARQVTFWMDPLDVTVKITTTGKTPREILKAAGFEPDEADSTFINGRSFQLDEEITLPGDLTLQYRPAVTLTVEWDGESQSFKTSAGTIGEALWQNGIYLRGGDQLSQPFNALIKGNTSVQIASAAPVEIEVDGITINTYVAAATVGEALVKVGVILQDLDYSIPAETEPLPADGKIKVVRVTEEVQLEQQSIPYETERIADDTLELDRTSVSQPGEYGIQAARVRIRYEDGVEVSRTSESSVVVKEPVKRVETYGTKITLQTMDTPNGPITYYRALTVTATSYSPCNSGVDECLYQTASGAPVKKGVIGVHLDWYRLLKGTQIYVPGYGIGTIADTGSYPPNHNWVDLGYTDAEFAAEGKFHGSITIYFLAPFPASQPWVLP